MSREVQHKISKIGNVIYPARVVGYATTLCIVFTYAYNNHGIGIRNYIYFAFTAGWPFLAFYLFKRYKQERQVENFNLLVDSALIGSSVFMMDFNLLPSLVVFLTVIVNNFMVNGFRQLVMALLIGVTSNVVLVLIFGYHNNQEECIYVNVITLVTYFMFAVSYSNTINRFASITKENKETYLEQKEDIIRQKKIIELKNEELMDGIIYARRIKDAFMFNEQDFREMFKNSFITMKSDLEVGGTYYWFKLDLNSVDIIVGRSENSGVPGSMINFVAVNIFMNIFGTGEVHYTDIMSEFEKRFKQYVDGKNQLSEEKMELLHVHIDSQTNMLWAKGVNTLLAIKSCDYEFVSCLHLSRGKAIAPGNNDTNYDIFKYNLSEGDFVYCSAGSNIPISDINVNSLVNLQDYGSESSGDFAILGFEYTPF